MIDLQMNLRQWTIVKKTTNVERFDFDFLKKDGRKSKYVYLTDRGDIIYSFDFDKKKEGCNCWSPLLVPPVFIFDKKEYHGTYFYYFWHNFYKNR